MGGTLENPLTNPEAYSMINQEASIGQSTTDMISSILGAINVIGVIIGVIILVIIGIKYVLGSAEQKAEYKETAKAYILGAIQISAGPTIVNILYTVARSL